MSAVGGPTDLFEQDAFWAGTQMVLLGFSAASRDIVGGRYTPLSLYMKP